MAADLTLDELQSKLNGRNGGWEAGRTSVSDLPMAKKQRLNGAILEPGFESYFQEAPTNRPTRSKLPAALDWRNKDGVNYASPILNQGDCGSCVAFATVGTLETQMNISRKTPYSPWQYSTQHLFACGGGACSMGWMPYAAVAFLKHDGIPDEACFPYVSGAAGDDLACNKSCGDSKSRSQKIAGSSQPTSFMSSPEKVKEALQKGPLMTTMQVYEDFYFYKAGVYKHTTGKLLGGHAVAIMGYSDADKAWIVRNSWGEDWGEKGYFRISWDDTSGVGRQTYLLDVGDSSGFVAAEGIRDKAVLSGQTTLRLNSTYREARKFSATLKPLGKEAVVVASSTPSITLDTTKTPDGVYELQIAAEHRDGTGKSLPHQVYVVNGPAKGTAAFKNVKAGATLKGKLMVEIEAKSAPVPFTYVTFRAKNIATGETFVKGTTNVAEKIILSWRTTSLKNGDYELSLTGDIGTKTVTPNQPIKVTIKN